VGAADDDDSPPAAPGEHDNLLDLRKACRLKVDFGSAVEGFGPRMVPVGVVCGDYGKGNRGIWVVAGEKDLELRVHR